jgi:imidazoleglycerol-phosphate dehydratase
MRNATFCRRTNETNIRVEVNLDGGGAAVIETPVGFLNHMLTALAKHSGLDLVVSAEGDVDIDYHHTVEDTGLAFGNAVARALGEKRGIRRFGSAYVPLDEALARAVIDFSGRPYLVFDVPIDREMLLVHKDFPFVLVEEFFKSFANTCACNLHIDLIRGRNGHHAAEAIFKAVAVAMREALSVRGGTEIPSTKGVL